MIAKEQPIFLSIVKKKYLVDVCITFDDFGLPFNKKKFLYLSCEYACKK